MRLRAGRIRRSTAKPWERSNDGSGNRSLFRVPKVRSISNDLKNYRTESLYVYE